MQIEERLNLLVKNFKEYLTFFKKDIIFEGPSIYFHRKVVDKIRNTPNYASLFQDNKFFEDIYATLTAWGLHRMGPRGAKLNEFSIIKESILRNKDEILELHNFKLENINEYKLEEMKPLIISLFQDLTTMKTKAKLIGNSKTMHHLLPDLVPPIDRQYTLNYFYNTTNITRKEDILFWEIMVYFHRINKELKLSMDDCKPDEFDTSVPKIIDNAIIGFVRKELN